MKIFGKELTFNGFKVWHQGTFNPDSKAEKKHNHVKSEITNFNDDDYAVEIGTSPQDLSLKLDLSGFYEQIEPKYSYPPGCTSWTHLINCQHSNKSNNYALQIAGSFFDQNLFFRKTNGYGKTLWNQIATVDKIPTKLSQLQNDVGAGGGIKIITSPTAPSNPSPGDFWYKKL